MKRTSQYDKNKILDAVALQDHYARTYKIRDLRKIKYSVLPAIAPKNSRNQPETDQAGREESSRQLNERGTGGRDGGRDDRMGWTGMRGKGRGKSTEKVVDKIDYRDIINKGIEKIDSKISKNNDDKYRVYYRKLTLAQRRGLVEAPVRPLNLEEWKKVVEKAVKRIDKEESVCPICMDGFKNKTQVILNCSHYFHKACIESFEKHTGEKRCPICRYE